MFWHVLSLVSACCYLVGMVCLAAWLSCADRNNALTRPAVRERSFNAALAGSISGMVCVLASFLLLPSGSFPAFIEGDMVLAGWLALFGGGCAGLVVADRTLSTQAVLGLLATPFLLLAVCAACIHHAYARGFPGSLWNVESYVTLPLATGSGLWQNLGFGCLAASVIVHGASFLLEKGRAVLLRSCLRLALAQFVVCLFFPLRLSSFWPLSSAAAMVADYSLYWVLVAALLLLFFPLAARVGRCRWISPALAGAGLSLTFL